LKRLPEACFAGNYPGMTGHFTTILEGWDMLKKMTTIGLALGLLLPGSAVYAETAQEQKELRVRTESQEMVQSGSKAAGDQERIQERTRTREEKQLREGTGEPKKQEKKQTQTRTASQKMLQKGSQAAGDQQRDRGRDRDRDHSGGGSQNRGGVR
jgi:hypothetical protein